MTQWLRPKELQQQFQDSQRLLDALNPLKANEVAESIVQEFHQPNTAALVRIQDHVLQDAQVLPWLLDAAPAAHCQGTQHWLKQMVYHPIQDPSLLRQRQHQLSSKKINDTDALRALTDTEADVLWALRLPPMDKAWPLPLLFPQWFMLRWMNRSSALLELYHFYRIYASTASHLIYPLTLLLGPWWYIRTKLKWKLPFNTYLTFLKKGLVELLKNRTGQFKEYFIKIATLMVYGGLYLYGVVQSIDIAYMLSNVRRQLKQRLDNIHRFISTTEQLWETHGFSKDSTGTLWGFPDIDTIDSAPFGISKHITGIYQLFKHGAYHARYLKTTLMKAYHLQGFARIQSAAALRPVRWLNSAPSSPTTPRLTMIGMTHPLLPDTQQSNPISLKKNLILTGPNAAGKSTYVRSLLSNVLLAQTIGLCFAEKAAMTPIHTIASFMRVHDVIGTQSLFEAECRRSLELIEQVAHTDCPAPTLLFLDEPMHATPPLEGAATAMALVHYLAQYKHVRLMITTHYHLLANLEKRAPTQFRNISMEAFTDPIRFTYRLQAGASFQSIALEMLEKDAFPEALLKDAIEIKNKICMFENNESQPYPPKEL